MKKLALVISFLAMASCATSKNVFNADRSHVSIRIALNKAFGKGFFKVTHGRTVVYKSKSFTYRNNRILAYEPKSALFYKLELFITGTKRPYKLKFKAYKYDASERPLGLDVNLSTKFSQFFFKELSKSPETYDLLDNYKPF